MTTAVNTLCGACGASTSGYCGAHGDARCPAELHGYACTDGAGHEPPDVHHSRNGAVTVTFCDANRTDGRELGGILVRLHAWEAHLRSCATCRTADTSAELCVPGADLWQALDVEPPPVKSPGPAWHDPEPTPPALMLRVVRSQTVPGALSVRVEPAGGADGTFQREITRLFREGDLLSLSLEVRR